MATPSSVLAWRIPGMGEPGGLLSMGSYRVGHDWSDLATAAAAAGESQSLETLSRKAAVTKSLSTWPNPSTCHTGLTGYTEIAKMVLQLWLLGQRFDLLVSWTFLLTVTLQDGKQCFDMKTELTQWRVYHSWGLWSSINWVAPWTKGSHVDEHNWCPALIPVIHSAWETSSYLFKYSFQFLAAFRPLIDLEKTH